MSRQRLLQIVAALLLVATAAVYAAALRPAMIEADQLSARRAQLELEVARLRAELARFQGTEPPSLPPIGQLHERLGRIAATVPARRGYSIRVDTPQPFPPGAQPLATQVRVVASVDGAYAEHVALLRELEVLPQAAVEEVSLSRVRGSPGQVRMSAAVVLLFEGAAAGPPPPAPQAPVTPGRSP